MRPAVRCAWLVSKCDGVQHTRRTLPSLVTLMPRVFLHAILFQPSVAGNVGTTARTALGLGAGLHIIAGGAGLPASAFTGAAPPPALKRASVGYLGGKGAPSPSTAPPELEGVPLWLYQDWHDFSTRGLPTFHHLAVLSKAQQYGNTELSDWRVALGRRTSQRHSSSDSTKDGEPLNIGVLIGNESRGLRDVPPPELAALEAAAGRRDDAVAFVCLPMRPPCRSYNAAVSAGVGLFEAWRQVTAAGGEVAPLTS